MGGLRDLELGDLRCNKAWSKRGSKSPGGSDPVLTGVAREGDILVAERLARDPPACQTAIVITGLRLQTSQVFSQIEHWDSHVS
jgi:hypothetical protein